MTEGQYRAIVAYLNFWTPLHPSMNIDAAMLDLSIDIPKDDVITQLAKSGHLYDEDTGRLTYIDDDMTKDVITLSIPFPAFARPTRVSISISTIEEFDFYRNYDPKDGWFVEDISFNSETFPGGSVTLVKGWPLPDRLTGIRALADQQYLQLAYGKQLDEFAELHGLFERGKGELFSGGMEADEAYRHRLWTYLYENPDNREAPEPVPTRNPDAATYGADDAAKALGQILGGEGQPDD